MGLQKCVYMVVGGAVKRIAKMKNFQLIHCKVCHRDGGLVSRNDLILRREDKEGYLGVYFSNQR